MVALEDWSTAFDEKPKYAALESRDGLGSFDWSMEFEENSVQLVMVATLPSSSTISEVCSNCNDMYQKLLSEYVAERNKFQKARSEIAGYQLTLESMEAKILTHENNEVAWAERYKQQEYQVKLSDWKLRCKVSELEKITNERDKLLEKLAVWNASGLSHVQFIEKQRTSNLKTGLGYENDCTEGISSKSSLTADTSTSDEEFIILDDNTSSDEEYPSPTPPEYKTDKSYNAVPIPQVVFNHLGKMSLVMG